MTAAVDVHAHAAPVANLAAMRAVHPDVIPDVEPEGDLVFFKYPNGVVNGPVPRGVVDLQSRLDDMAQMGVDHQILSARPQMFTYDLDGNVAGRLAALTNEALVDVAESHPEAFGVMICLPVQSAEISIAEIERWAPNRKVRGVMVDSNIAGRDFADPELAPIWAALESADLPVLVHPYQADVVGKERLQKHYLFNLIGNPADTTIAIGNVLFGGLLDAYPGLRWGFVHGGGVAPYLAGRWDHGWRQREVTRERIPDALPSELLRRCWFDCLVHDSRALRYLADLVGWDRIMLGTDYPFDMGYRDPIGFLDSVGLTSGERAAVLSGSAEGFLRAV